MKRIFMAVYDFPDEKHAPARLHESLSDHLAAWKYYKGETVGYNTITLHAPSKEVVALVEGLTK